MTKFCDICYIIFDQAGALFKFARILSYWITEVPTVWHCWLSSAQWQKLVRGNWSRRSTLRRRRPKDWIAAFNLFQKPFLGGTPWMRLLLDPSASSFYPSFLQLVPATVHCSTTNATQSTPQLLNKKGSLRIWTKLLLGQKKTSSALPPIVPSI